MAEFAYNSVKSETTGMSPCEANYGMLPKQTWEPLNKTPYVNPASSLLENVWKGTWEWLEEKIYSKLKSGQLNSITSNAVNNLSSRSET